MPEPPAGSFTPFTAQMTLADGTTASVQGAAVTPAFFESTDSRPLLGRLIVAGDHAVGSTGVVVISHAFWSTRLNSRPEIIGQTITVDGRTCVIIGIMPRGFEVPAGAQIWTPMAPSPVDR